MEVVSCGVPFLFVPVRNNDGRTIWWIGISTYIHDRKQAEAERRVACQRAGRAPRRTIWLRVCGTVVLRAVAMLLLATSDVTDSLSFAKTRPTCIFNSLACHSSNQYLLDQNSISA